MPATANAHSNEVTHVGGYWVRSELPEPTELPTFPSFGDDIDTEVGSVIDDPFEDDVQTEEVPASALAALSPRLPPAATSTDELPRLDAAPTPTADDRKAQLAAAIAADLDALDADQTEEATDMQAAAVDSEAPTGQFDSSTIDSWDDAFAIADEPAHSVPSAPSLSLVQEAPVGPADEDYQDVLATPLPGPPRPASGAAWPPPPRRPVVTEPLELPDDPWTEWVDDAGAETVVIHEASVHRPAASPLWIALQNGVAWALGFFTSFFAGASMCFTIALVSFAITL